jgi:WS/DGAT/MGAT family acyltransferase
MLRGTTAGLPFFTARSAMNGPLTSRRTLAYTSVPLTDVYALRSAFDVKVNDIVLALVSAALRRWLLAGDALPRRSLVAEVPVSVRTESTKDYVGTQVANSFVTLATDIDDPVDRLHAIHRSSIDARTLQRDLAAHKHVNLSDVPPPRALGLAVRLFGASGLEGRMPPIYSAIVSSVPGPQMDFYVAGAKVEAVYPIGPLLYGSGVNITALTMGNHIHFGIVACPDVVEDPWPIADGIPEAVAELLQRAPAPKRRSRRTVDSAHVARKSGDRRGDRRRVADR